MVSGVGDCGQCRDAGRNLRAHAGRAFGFHGKPFHRVRWLHKFAVVAMHHFRAVARKPAILPASFVNANEYKANECRSPLLSTSPPFERECLSRHRLQRQLQRRRLPGICKTGQNLPPKLSRSCRIGREPRWQILRNRHNASAGSLGLVRADNDSRSSSQCRSIPAAQFRRSANRQTSRWRARAESLRKLPRAPRSGRFLPARKFARHRHSILARSTFGGIVSA